jgi:hypothetical protein
MSNRIFRRLSKSILKDIDNPRNILPIKKDEVSDVYLYAKDGKSYVTYESVVKYINDNLRKARLEVLNNGHWYRNKVWDSDIKAILISDWKFKKLKSWIDLKSNIFYKTYNNKLLDILEINNEEDLNKITSENFSKAVDYLYNKWAFGK